MHYISQTPDRVSSAATVGDDVRYQGVPYYMQQMNEWVREFTKKVNDIFTSREHPDISHHRRLLPTCNS